MIISEKILKITMSCYISVSLIKFPYNFAY